MHLSIIVSAAARIALAAACGLAASQAPAEVAADKGPLIGPEPVAACERAVRQSLDTPGVPSADVGFAVQPTIERSLSNDAQLVLRGAGRARGPNGVRTFTYFCTVDLRTVEAVGLVLRDTIAVSAHPTPAPPPSEPDLSHLSPAACESSAVQALKQRWPRVSQISFDSGTRSLVQDSASRAELHGSGRALPAPDGTAMLFGFDCEIDPRDGRVLSTRVSG